MERIDHLPPWSTLGSEKRLSVFRFGLWRARVYIQSSLHADELPGMRTAWELKQRLRLLEAEGRLRGTVELVPVANPVSLAGQMVQALHQGRLKMSSGRNFNRDFPDLLDAVIDSGRRASPAAIRRPMSRWSASPARAALDALPPATRNWRARRLLYRHASDADLVSTALRLRGRHPSTPAAAMARLRLPARTPGAALSGFAEESAAVPSTRPARCRGCAVTRSIRGAELPLACLATTSNSGQPDQTEAGEEGQRRPAAFLAEQGFVEGDGRRRPKPAAGLRLRGHRKYVHALQPAW